MGSLDDAIREHLELKRQHGASDEEVKRQEEEAFGRGRRTAPEEAPAAERTAAEDLPETQLPEPQPIEAAEPQSNGQPADHVEASSTLEPEPFDPDEVPAEEALQPEVTVRDVREEPSVEWDEAEADKPEDEPAADPLQDTPEFLEGSPEEDKLWFEQRPPKDFDLD